jgi:hypothetical protein
MRPRIRKLIRLTGMYPAKYGALDRMARRILGRTSWLVLDDERVVLLRDALCQRGRPRADWRSRTFSRPRRLAGCWKRVAVVFVVRISSGASTGRVRL